jgi:hypothetical protein
MERVAVANILLEELQAVGYAPNRGDVQVAVTRIIDYHNLLVAELKKVAEPPEE